MKFTEKWVKKVQFSVNCDKLIVSKSVVDGAVIELRKYTPTTIDLYEKKEQKYNI